MEPLVATVEAALTPDDRTAVLELEGRAPWSEHKRLGLANLARRGDRCVLVRRGDTIVGAAVAADHEGTWNVEVAGDDSARAVALEAAFAMLGSQPVQFWLPPSGLGPALGSVVDTRQCTERRILLRLERDLRATPATPPELSAAPFDDAEVDQWVAVNNEAFASHPEQGAWTPTTFVERASEPWYDPSLFLVHHAGSSIAAWCWCKVDADRDPTRGEIYVIGVAPAAQGQRLGAALLEAGCAAMAARGVTVVELFVESTNAVALGLYARHGFSEAGSMECRCLTP